MINSMAGLLKIHDKFRQLRPLIPNNTQLKILETVFKMESEGKPIRIIALKGRQQGSSTGIGAYCFLRALCEANTNALIITEEKGGSAKNIFQMYKTFADNLPDMGVKREFTRENTFMKFATPLNSQIRVEGGTITSFTFQVVHLSEAAFFRNLRETISMLYQTVPDTDSAIFLESTANRHGDDFYQEWIRAVNGKSDFFPLFIPWFTHEEYQRDFDSDLTKEQLGNSLGNAEGDEYGNEQQLVEAHPELTLEKINWRRHAIRNRCAGSIHEFDRQYPVSWEVAFRTQVASIFDLNRIGQLKSKAPRVKKGHFNETPRGVEFRPMGVAVSKVYRFPDEAYKSGYIIGADVAEGLDTGDYSCAVVMKRLPMEVVCVIRAGKGEQLSLDYFADQIKWAAKYYDNASICVESNADGSAVNLLLSERGAGNLLRERDIQISDSSRFGWRNTSSTRRLGVALLQTYFNKGEFLVYDDQILQELNNFVTVNGKPQAVKKGQRRKPGEDDQGWFDDGVFACISALLAHEGLPAPKPSRWVEKKERLIEERRWEEDRKPKSVWDYV